MATATAPPASSEALTEIIDGVEVELPSVSRFASRVASILVQELGVYARRQRLGEVDSEALFRIPTSDDPERCRRPDVAYTSYTRWPRHLRLPPRDNTVDVVPDLVVEVISPTDNHTEVNEKVLQYFAAGVRRVWEIDPVLRRAVDHASPDEVRVIRDGGSFDGGEVVPGFRIALSELLDPPE